MTVVKWCLSGVKDLRFIVCNRDYLILNLLFNFEPRKGLEYWADVKMFGSAGNGTCKSILNVEGA